MSIWTHFFRAEHLVETQSPIVRLLPAPVSPTLADAALKAEVTQLKFLVTQAPMLDFIPKLDFVSSARAPYGLVHPKTLAPVAKFAHQKKTIAPYVMFPGSNTMWIVTSLMPEGRVIFTPNPLPGYEKRLA